MSHAGNLVEYILDPHLKSGIEKSTDDSPIEVTASAKGQWSLIRLGCQIDWSFAEISVYLAVRIRWLIIMACYNTVFSIKQAIHGPQKLYLLCPVLIQ